MGSQVPEEEPGGGGLDSIRKMLAEKSGHLELVTDYNGADYSDSGADDILNAAQRMLDREFKYPKEDAWFFQNQALHADPVLVTFAQARVIKQAKIKNAAGGWTVLRRIPYTEMFGEDQRFWGYPWNYTVPSNTDYIPPSNAYCLAPIRMAPAHDGETAAGTYPDNDMQYVVFGNTNWPLKAIILSPQTEAYELWVLGAFHSSDLSDANPISFWTHNPELLMLAARIRMEEHHRNTQGWNDLMTALQHHVRKIYHDCIAEREQGPAKDWRVQT